VLSGKKHTVYTALALRDAGSGRVVADVEASRVTFRAVSDQQIEDYVDSGEPMDKAGAYGIQGMGEFLVDRLDGRLNNVIGFPLQLFVRLLRELAGGL
jgi:septum formation protein